MYTKNSNVMPRTIGGLLENAFQNGFNRMWADDHSIDTSHAPVNIQDMDECYELQVIAPGLNKEEFKLAVNNNVLTISYDHKEDVKEQSAKMLRSEYIIRSFKRSFTLNEKIDTKGISASYTNGILYVTMPKKEQVKPTTQQISVD